jgi:hypothetical protein
MTETSAIINRVLSPLQIRKKQIGTSGITCLNTAEPTYSIIRCAHTIIVPLSARIDSNLPYDINKRLRSHNNKSDRIISVVSEISRSLVAGGKNCGI